MAYASDLTLSLDNATAVATSTHTFTLAGSPQGKSMRIDTLSTSAEPVTLEISHRAEGSGTGARDVRSITYRKKKLNATGQLVEGSVTVTFRCPKDSAIPTAELRYGCSVIANLLYASGNTNFDRLFRGEV